jgi:hypothetical protein
MGEQAIFSMSGAEKTGHPHAGLKVDSYLTAHIKIS